MFCFTFNVGYMMGTQKIFFSESDDILTELHKIVTRVTVHGVMDCKKRSKVHGRWISVNQ